MIEWSNGRVLVHCNQRAYDSILDAKITGKAAREEIVGSVAKMDSDVVTFAVCLVPSLQINTMRNRFSACDGVECVSKIGHAAAF